MSDLPIDLSIREAVEHDRGFVERLMVDALQPFYGGDHKRHARRIFDLHISGGQDRLGFFSFEQKMFIAVVGSEPIGMVHLVGKRQNTYKISPLIVEKGHRHAMGVGRALLAHAIEYATTRSARQLYCTVAEENHDAYKFFLRNGFIKAGNSPSHYKEGVTESMLYLPLLDLIEDYDGPHVSVVPLAIEHEAEVAELLLATLPQSFHGIDPTWVESLFEGYRRRASADVNAKYKLIWVATLPSGKVLGVVGATPKKGSPIKLMPLVATDQIAFEAILRDIPFMLTEYGHKLYLHMVPSVDETIALQRLGWVLDAAMPAAYNSSVATEQWSFELRDVKVRTLRVKNRFFQLIMAGKKDLEVRVGYDNIRKIRRGDTLRLNTRDETGDVRVTDVRNYSTFDALFAQEDAGRIAPDDPDGIKDLLKEIYPPNKESLGVVVLQLLPMTDLSKGSDR